MPHSLLRESLAEFIGTFILVFIGAASVLVAPIYGLLVPAFAHGFIVIGLIYTFGHISGTQINPAVTLALFVGRQQNATKSAIFILVQFVGGIVAAIVLVLLFPQDNSAVVEFLGSATYNFGETKGFLTTDSIWSAAVYEGILVFILVTTIFQTAVYSKAQNLAGVAIGLTLTALILGGGPATGASINPARSLGPALMASVSGHDIAYIIPYCVGLFAGGAIAGLFNTHILYDVTKQN